MGEREGAIAVAIVVFVALVLVPTYFLRKCYREGTIVYSFKIHPLSLTNLTGSRRQARPQNANNNNIQLNNLAPVPGPAALPSGPPPPYSA